MGKSWKTTVSAGISAAAAFVLFAGQPPISIHFPVWLTAIAAFLMAGGLAALGINAKDSQVTGGSVVQLGIPVAAVVQPVAPLVAAPVAPAPLELQALPYPSAPVPPPPNVSKKW